jgi:hypothetical protein
MLTFATFERPAVILKQYINQFHGKFRLSRLEGKEEHRM